MALSKHQYTRKRHSTISVDSVLKVQYKEYTFRTNANKEIEEKVASFWRAIGDKKPPKHDFFKLPDIENCAGSNDEDKLSEEELSVSEQVDQQWKYTNTLCLFKKKNLLEAAKAAVPKQCSMCNNEKFAPLFADEQCEEMVKDYGKSQQDINPVDSV